MKKIILLATVSSLVLLALNSKKKDIPTTGAIIMPEFKNETKGIVVRFENEDVMLISETAAIILSGPMNFTGLENGDELTIYYDDLEETFPSRAMVKEMILNSKGNIDRANINTLNKLIDLGWTIKH